MNFEFKNRSEAIEWVEKLEADDRYYYSSINCEFEDGSFLKLFRRKDVKKFIYFLAYDAGKGSGSFEVSRINEEEV